VRSEAYSIRGKPVAPRKPRVLILDLEGYIIVEDDDGGPYAEFAFPSGIETFARASLLPSDLFESALRQAIVGHDTWSYDPCKVGSKVYGEAPERTIPNRVRVINVARWKVKNWAIFVINRTSELFIRIAILDPDIRVLVKNALTPSTLR